MNSVGNEKISKFTYQWIEETIEFLSDEGDYDVSYDPDTVVATDSVRDVLSELERESWDHIDNRGDGTIICYPADSTQSMVTGNYSRNELIIKAKRPEWADKLMACYNKPGPLAKR